MQQQKFVISPAPHIKANHSVRTMMLDTIIALLPAGIGSVIFFGWYAAGIILVSVVVAMLSELVTNLLRKQHLSITDLSCVITGILFAYTLPPRIPLWIVVIGSFVAIVFGKQVFGGIGFNPFNPALVGRAFVHIAFPQQMGNFVVLPQFPDSITTATPLTILKHFPEQIAKIPEITTLLIGNYPSSLGETSVILLTLGFIYLVIKKHVFALMSIAYLLTISIITFIIAKENIAIYLFSGGIFLAAMFMITDPVTTPVSSKGKVIFAIGCGILTCLIRFYGSYPEGACFSILLMNLLTPLIDNYTIVKKFGMAKK